MRQNPVGPITLALAMLACGSALAGPASRPPGVQHLVVITIDGLHPDAIAAAPAKNLQRLLQQSAWSLAARTVGKPVTLPGHVSMLTGLAPDAHGIIWDNDRGGTLKLPSLFTRVQDAGGATALLFGKSKLILLAGARGADLAQGPGAGESRWESGADRALADRFAAEFRGRQFRLAMIHLREPDHVGHQQGWMSSDYLAAVRESDAALKVVLDAIESSGVASATAVLLTSDHGGEGTRHFSGNAASETIPWLCRVPGVKPGEIRGTVRTVDIAPTGLALLGLPALEKIDGKTVGACLP